MGIGSLFFKLLCKTHTHTKKKLLTGGKKKKKKEFYCPVQLLFCFFKIFFLSFINKVEVKLFYLFSKDSLL